MRTQGKEKADDICEEEQDRRAPRVGPDSVDVKWVMNCWNLREKASSAVSFSGFHQALIRTLVTGEFVLAGFSICFESEN